MKKKTITMKTHEKKLKEYWHAGYEKGKKDGRKELTRELLELLNIPSLDEVADAIKNHTTLYNHDD
jgi:hypothetical protein